MKRNKLLKLGFFLTAMGSSIFLLKELYCMIMYLYNISIKRGDKTFLTKLIDVSQEADVLCEDLEEEGNRISKWAREKKSYELYIKGYKNTTLYGEVFENESDKWVIILHGYGGEGELMYYAGEKFYNMGYNVLIPDLRGHSKSGGKYISMGWQDRLDLNFWIKEIIKENKNAKIVLYGVSMGGATVVMCSGEKLKKNVKCIIEDCGYTSAYSIFACQLKKLKAPAFPLIHLMAIVCGYKNKFNIFKASAIKQIKKSSLPMLFLHGDKDNFVPPFMMNELYNAKKNGYKQRYIFKGAGHGVSAMVHREDYWNKVFKFCDKFIK